MDVYERLLQDHEELRDLFAKLDQPEELESFGRQQLFQDLRMKLLAHDKAEEQTFYHAIDGGKKLHALVQDGVKDHHKVARLLEEMTNVAPANAKWLDRMREIREMFLKHAGEEEQQMFPRSRNVLKEQAAENIGREFQETELRILMQERSEWRPQA